MTSELTKTDAKEILANDFISNLDLIKQINSERKNHITFSKNIFLPLTHICKNNCGYCTFKHDVNETEYIIMPKQQVLSDLNKAKKFNCTEALFTFGESADENEVVLEKLNSIGYDSMVEYVYDLSNISLNEYDILPHTNMGIVNYDDLEFLSQVNASMGLMLETTNKKLLKTIVHKDSPTKDPKKRLNFIKDTGKLNIPFTTGLLVGIGETVNDHIDSLFEIRKLHDKYGHIQEIILQNFKPKENTAMSDYPEPSSLHLLKLTILASLMFPDVSIQIPPNLNKQILPFFVLGGADDLGGISPLSDDFINPNDKWPKISNLSRDMEEINFKLKERLPVYDKFINKDFLNDKVYEKAIKLRKRF